MRKSWYFLHNGAYNQHVAYCSWFGVTTLIWVRWHLTSLSGCRPWSFKDGDSCPSQTLRYFSVKVYKCEAELHKRTAIGNEIELEGTQLKGERSRNRENKRLSGGNGRTSRRQGNECSGWDKIMLRLKNRWKKILSAWKFQLEQ